MKRKGLAFSLIALGAGLSSRAMAGTVLRAWPYSDETRASVELYDPAHGYPIATIAFYGPDDKRASKAAVAILNAQGAEPTALERWFTDECDVRTDPAVGSEPTIPAGSFVGGEFPVVRSLYRNITEQPQLFWNIRARLATYPIEFEVH